MSTGEITDRPERELQSELQRVYDLRFRQSRHYRIAVWKILTREFFQPLISPSSHILDLG